MMTHQSTSQTVASLLREVRFSKVCEKGRETGFRELFEIQQNISRIEHWFSRGLGDMEAIFDQFKALHGAGKYRFHPTGDALSYELCLSYTITMQHQQQEVELRPQELKDLVSRLSFVQHDEKAKGLPVAQFLAEYQQYNNAASIMQELADLGNAKYLEAQSERRVLGDMLSVVVSFTRNVADELAKWKTLLAEQRASYRLLALFTTAEARRLADLLGHARVQPDVSLSVFNAQQCRRQEKTKPKAKKKTTSRTIRERRRRRRRRCDGATTMTTTKTKKVQEKDEDAIASIVQIVVRLTQREASAIQKPSE